MPFGISFNWLPCKSSVFNLSRPAKASGISCDMLAFTNRNSSKWRPAKARLETLLNLLWSTRKTVKDDNFFRPSGISTSSVRVRLIIMSVLLDAPRKASSSMYCRGVSMMTSRRISMLWNNGPYNLEEGGSKTFHIVENDIRQWLVTYREMRELDMSSSSIGARALFSPTDNVAKFVLLQCITCQ